MEETDRKKHEEERRKREEERGREKMRKEREKTIQRWGMREEWTRKDKEG